jgi:amidohydrolase
MNLEQTILDNLIRVRRHLHERPELSLVEFETAGFIEAELRTLPFDEIRTKIGKTGILATLKGGKPGPVTLLRADMDALPITETGDAPYKSQNVGAMHACGHDGHVSILLAAAKTLAARKDDVPGTLVFCFQPGEEGYAGNRLMIEDGALENPHVDRTFALHLYSGLDVGKIGVRDGAFFASADEFDLTIRGTGGHGAMPQNSIDPIVAGAYFVTMLQTIVSREVAPKDPAVFTVGQFTSGTTFNVIPDEAHLKGTVRSFDPEIRKSMPVRMERIIKGLAEAMRVEYDLHYHWSYPPTVNEKAMNDLVREVGRATIGPDNVIEHDIVMWAEDMSFMMEQRPTTGIPHHNAKFDLDERGLETGYAMMVALGMRG